MDAGTLTQPMVLGGALVAAAIAFFVLEAHAPGVGLPAAIGGACLLVGGWVLVDAGAPASVLVAGSAVVVLSLGALLRASVRARRLPLQPRSLLGAEGVASSDLRPAGTVRVRGEEWSAETAGDPITAGERVVVIETEGLRLRVIGV